MQPHLTPLQAAARIRHYCAYQERSHAEVKERLYSYGLHKSEVDSIVTDLIAENFLNEERFAIQYAGGKFRVKHWGKVKITQALRQKQVSPYCIKKALKEIDEVDYRSTLEKLASEKLRTLRTEKNPLIKKRKLQVYLLQKGYESSLVGDLVRSF